MTGSTYIDFDIAYNKGAELLRRKQTRNFGFLIIVGINTGLRIGDLLILTFGDLRKDSFTVVEGDRETKRTITVNERIKLALNYFEEQSDDTNCFLSQKGTVYETQSINKLLKKTFNLKKVSTHSLRKTFGRRVWEKNNQTDGTLVHLADLFGHKSIAVTRKYLGIHQDELVNVYINL
jgi:integrase